MLCAIHQTILTDYITYLLTVLTYFFHCVLTETARRGAKSDSFFTQKFLGWHICITRLTLYPSLICIKLSNGNRTRSIVWKSLKSHNVRQYTINWRSLEYQTDGSVTAVDNLSSVINFIPYHSCWSCSCNDFSISESQCEIGGRGLLWRHLLTRFSEIIVYSFFSRIPVDRLTSTAGKIIR